MGDGSMELLVDALCDGDQDRAVVEVKGLRQAGAGREWIVTNGVEVAMARLDAKCTVEQFNLLEIMLAGRAVMGVVKELYPQGVPPDRTKATVVLGALEGDVHDLGKNIVKMVLTARGYRVVDCGKDCPVDRLVATASAEGAVAVGVSGLLTSVIPNVRRVRDQLERSGLGTVKVMAGGAALRQASAASLNVDFRGETAFDAVSYLDRIHRGGGR